MSQKIKIIGGRILKFFAWIVFLFSTYFLLLKLIDLLFPLYEYRYFYKYSLIHRALSWFDLIMLGIAIGSGYIIHNTLFIPFRSFARLVLKKKIALFAFIIALFVLILAGFNWYQKRELTKVCILRCERTASGFWQYLEYDKYFSTYDECINWCLLWIQFWRPL